MNQPGRTAEARPDKAYKELILNKLKQENKGGNKNLPEKK
jgi:hypothetical protein